MSGDIQQKALALFEQGKLSKAKMLYKKIARRDSSSDIAWIMLGIINRRLGLLAEAAHCYRNALAIHPERPDTLNNLGNVLKEQGATEKAIQYFSKAVAVKPGYGDALFNLGNAYLDCDNSAAAIDCYRRVSLMQPDFPGALQKQGLAHFQRREFAAAESCYRRALAIDPRTALNHHNLSLVLHVQMKFQQALQPGRESVRLQPGDALSWLHLSMVLAALDQFEEATEAFTRACQLDKRLVNDQLFQDWIKPIPEDALLPQWSPEYAYILARLNLLTQCDWDQREAFLSRLVSITEAELKSGKKASLPAFQALSLPLAPELQRAATRSQSNAIEEQMAPLRTACQFHYSSPSKQRLRVGYLSADFRDNAVAHVSQALFSAHDREQFEIFGYALNRDDGSDYYRHISEGCDRFVKLVELSNADAARRIHQDEIQILVDLTGHTRFARQEILALRPAPVQVQHLGYPGSSQAPYMDYLIADPWVAPSSGRSLFSEHLVFMPECYFSTNDRQEIAASGITRSDCGLPDNGVVFVCFNQAYKLEPVLFDIWMKILGQVPGSVLWLANLSPLAQKNIRVRASARGIAGQRLIVKSHWDAMPRYLKMLQCADLGLDTLLYNGHATTAHTLWGGIPVITCSQQSFASRVAASQLQNIGLPELVVDSLESYQDLAVHLARHPNELAELKTKLQRNRLTHPLFNTQRYARHLEQAYRMMWEVYAAGEPARDLHVPKQASGNRQQESGNK